VDKRNAQRPVEMFSEAGKVGPAYCTGVGKAMMAYLGEAELQRLLPQQSYHRFTPHTLADATALCAELREIRRRGHAFDREEHEPGIICVAMPILTRRGRVLGAISVTGSTARTDLAALEALVPVIRPVVDQISRDAENWWFPDEAKRETQSMTAGT